MTEAVDKKLSNILIAEDDPILGRILTEILEHHAYSVTLAPSGRIALEQFKKQKFDLVIMDCNLPEMSGVDVTKAIRGYENSDTNPVPIIAHTSDTRLTTLKNCLKSGMNDYLMKPATQTELLTTVAQWLSEPEKK